MKAQQETIFFQRSIVVCTISLFALPCFGNGIMPQTVWARSIVAQGGSVTFTPPPPPPDRDAPGQRVGAASRSCSFAKTPLMALVPEYKNARTGQPSSKVWGTTLAARPTLWFDVPYERKDINTIFLTLEDDANPAQEPYQSEIVPPETPGIVRIQLPATVPPLKTGSLYHWIFLVNLRCGDSNSRSVDGWIQRVSPNATLTSQLQQATPQQQVALYAQKGIWFDTLTTLANLRLANPHAPTVLKDWESLLQSVGLQELAQKPFVPCCKPR